MNGRLAAALLCYAVLGGAGFFTLDGTVRWFILLLLGAMAAKTGIAYLRHKQD